MKLALWLLSLLLLLSVGFQMVNWLEIWLSK